THTPRSHAMTTVPTTSTAAAPATTAPATGRLGQGELRRRVAAILADRPGVTFTPGEISRELSRSAGAVGNALTVLVDRGQAELGAPGPRRDRATPTTAEALRGSGPAPARTTPTPAAAPVPAPAAAPTKAVPAPTPATSGGSGKAAATGGKG